MLIGLGVDVYQLGKTLVSGASPNIPRRECPLLAQSRHEVVHRTCPLSGVKRTWPVGKIRFRGRYWG
jgi:hypothetical protein